jgi:hypothetical protein
MNKNIFTLFYIKMKLMNQKESILKMLWGTER